MEGLSIRRPSEQRLIEVEEALEELREKNKTIPIVVEGIRDKESLRKLEVKGRIIVVNKGKSLSDFCDQLSMKYSEIILLTDWDRRGGRICSMIMERLAGRIRCDTEIRRRFARHAAIKEVEGLPSWMESMKEKVRGYPKHP
jgi:5S rRNA maturation endonuclease (ribonuclease M5)